MQVALFSGMGLTHAGAAPLEVMRTTRDAVRLADEAGFDFAWFAEHHFSDFSICASPMLMAMHCAAVTRRIRLGPGVLVLPLLEPLRALQEIGMLDLASEGRAVVGIGNGHQPHEFRSLGRDIGQRHDVFMEGWDILEMGLRDGRVAYSGRHHEIPETFVAARPLDGRMPDLLVAAHDPRMMARAAASGAVVFISPGPRTLDAALAQRAQVMAAAATAGVAEKAVRLGVQRYVFVTDDRAEARAAAEAMVHFMRRMRSLRDQYPPRDGLHLRSVPYDGEPTAEWLLAHAAIGDAALVRERLAADVAALNPAVLSVYMSYVQLPSAALLRSLERFARDVLPGLAGVGRIAA